MEITHNHIDDFARTVSEKRMATTTRPGYYRYDGKRMQSENIHSFGVFSQDFTKMKALDKSSTYASSPYNNYQQRKSLTTISSNVVDSSYQQTTTSSVPNNKNNFFVDWGMRVDQPDVARKRETSDSIKPKIKIPNTSPVSTKNKAAHSDPYFLKNYRRPISTHPGMYGHEAQTTPRYTTDFSRVSLYSATPSPPPVYTPATTQRTLGLRQEFKNSFYNSFHHLDPLKPYQPAITFLDNSVSAEAERRSIRTPGHATPPSQHFPPLGQNYQIFKPNDIQDSVNNFGNPKPSPPIETSTYSSNPQFFQGGPNFADFNVYTKNIWTADPVLTNVSRRNQPKQADKTFNVKQTSPGKFSDREPGGYYIKVFNNDGNNYSIKDGNFHKDSKATSVRPIKNHNLNKTLKSRTVGQKNHEGNNWDNFESSEISENFPFLF